MKILKDLPALLQALAALNASDWVDMPQEQLKLLEAADNTAPVAVLTSTDLRLIARSSDSPSRMGYAPWLPVAVLQAMPWPQGSDVNSEAWQAMLQAEFGRSQRFADSAEALWPDEQVPEPHWPGESDKYERALFWRLGLQAHAWMDEELLQPTACSRAELRMCEWRLACSLPAALRDYHLHLGVLDWAETLQSVPFDRADAGSDMYAIGPVQAVFPGIVDVIEMASPDDAAQALQAINQMVVFGDYLGNGNLWCFSREDGAVWYLDHDTSPLLTRVFDDVGDYLDALALLSLCRAHAIANGLGDGDERAEVMLSERFGKALVRKWMY